MALYETDFYSWTQEQAALLKAGKLGELDSFNLLEEIYDMGNSERRELETRLKQLLLHLLKWRYQPNLQTRSWLFSIKEQRIRAAKVLRKNPGLKPELPELIKDAYQLAVLGAAKQTGLDEAVFPEACPWDFEEQIMVEGFLPGAAGT